MVHVCCVPGCSSRSDRERSLSYFGLPLSNKSLLKQWIHAVGRANLPINSSTRICSRHFLKAEGRRLYCGEVPSRELPILPTSVTPTKPRKPPKERLLLEPRGDSTLSYNTPVDQGVNTDWDVDAYLETQKSRIESLEAELCVMKLELSKQKFSLENIKDNNKLVVFYTGFPSYSALNTCFTFLGPAVNFLQYHEAGALERRYRPHILSPIEEFFLVMVRLRLGLMEQDLAYRFNVSQSTVSRITTAWINFMYLQFKQVPLWPCKEVILSHMPKVFREQYPSTRVIIDATEIYVEQPRLPELQQMTFSNYKNDNTYKALIGISPSGAITFISKLFPGSISDKELTCKCGLLDLLDPGDSVMADKGFDIEEYLIPLGVKLNIPPFLRGKVQFNQSELVQTRRIASLRIHVERAMERIKNFHIFDRTLQASLTGIADRMFYVCCFLCNFHPPLCA